MIFRSELVCRGIFSAEAPPDYHRISGWRERRK